MGADHESTTRDDAFSAIWSSDGVTRSLGPTAADLPADLPFLFSSGQRFGPYLIVRPLGKGGMGQVYEAEEAESGRRIAIKILSRGIGDDEERERFLREGRLAASLSHPNCVYVFGTREVQGFRVIAMELAPAGTLKDLVAPGAPLAVTRAVDAILQVIAGLDAAAAIGILHRDVKPSNCFLTHDGRVMVGDFGLSIATEGAGRSSAEPGSISGTPGFASPEQLRGESLDVRSDIYAVGATLFYLLAGRTPLDSEAATALLERRGLEAAPSLASFRPDVPRRLVAVVAKCLAVAREGRHASYAALAAALEPFRSTAFTPAPIGRRLLAGIIDVYVSALPLMPFNLLYGARLLQDQQNVLVLAVPALLCSLLYYSLLEGRFGCGAGKALLNLRVVDESRMAPGVRRAALRALAFLVPQHVASQSAAFIVMRSLGGGRPPIGPENFSVGLAGLASLGVSLLTLAAMFSTVRRANGFAAVHDRVSRTRVVSRPRSIEARSARGGTSSHPGWDAAAVVRVGPYDVPAESAAAAVPATVEAYDDRLRRRVWLRLQPAGTPPLGATRRDLDRPGRARWLSGRRTEAECWDAFEAIPGEPWLDTIATPQPWARVRHWLADLTHEVCRGLADGSLPELSPDRLWVGADDRVRLLDWRAPGPTRSEAIAPATDPAAPDIARVQRFLHTVVVASLGGSGSKHRSGEPPRTPLPIVARSLLASLESESLPDAGAIAAKVDAAIRGPAEFTRRSRGMQLAACAAIPALLGISTFSAVKLRIQSQSNEAEFALDVSLKRLAALNAKPPDRITADEASQRDAIETYVGERLRAEAEDRLAWGRAFPGTSSIQREARAAERALSRPRTATGAQLATAEQTVRTLVATDTRRLTDLAHPIPLMGIVAFVTGGAALVVACFGLLAAGLFRGGMTIRALGGALVTADGRDASRPRAMWRAAVAWSPVLLWILPAYFGPNGLRTTLTGLLLYALAPAALAAGAAIAWLNPSRGVQDRIAGTWIVPR